jgi:hypothetical protein
MSMRDEPGSRRPLLPVRLVACWRCHSSLIPDQRRERPTLELVDPFHGMDSTQAGHVKSHTADP